MLNGARCSTADTTNIRTAFDCLLLGKLCRFRCVSATKSLECVSSSSSYSAAVSFHASLPHSRIGRTKISNSLIFVFRPMLCVFQIFFKLKNAPRAYHPLLSVVPRYTNSSTSSTSSLRIITFHF